MNSRMLSPATRNRESIASHPDPTGNKPLFPIKPDIRKRRIREWFRRNNIRLDKNEISGSLGDLGTFIPLAVGMVERCGMNLGHVLFFAGAMNVVTGFIFRLPIPVQPMKAIAAVAIAEGMTPRTIMSAGIIAGAVLFILSITGLVESIGRSIPKSAVRGIQLAVGVKLALKGIEMIAGTNVIIGSDSILTAVACFAIAIIAFTRPRIPAAAIIFVGGIALLFISRPGILSHLTFGSQLPHIIFPSFSELVRGGWRGALPQVPLTMLNSAVAVCVLSGDLFPERPLPMTRVSLSVALMNLTSCPFGGMPMCHGSGGLAAQYGFGARTGGSVIFLGVCKMALGVAFGGSLLIVIQHYPASVLGTLLCFSGYKLASVCTDQRSVFGLLVMGTTMIVSLATNMAVGALAGLILAAVLRKRINLQKEIIRPATHNDMAEGTV